MQIRDPLGLEHLPLPNELKESEGYEASIGADLDSHLVCGRYVGPMTVLSQWFHSLKRINRCIEVSRFRALPNPTSTLGGHASMSCEGRKPLKFVTP
jgi:hypothetical protein